MLDEVDAPLDEANAGRVFCELVKEMAQETQFFFISPNEITLAVAELIGVTMQEKGVSRVPAVRMEDILKNRW